MHRKYTDKGKKTKEYKVKENVIGRQILNVTLFRIHDADKTLIVNLFNIKISL